MKALCLGLFGFLLACTPSAKNRGNNPQLGLVQSDNEDLDQEEVNPPLGTPEVPVSTENGTLTPAIPPQPACTEGSPASSDHAMMVTRDPVSGLYVFDFKNPEDRKLRAISLYLTARNDRIPGFDNQFEFFGTAYWMVSIEDPFETNMNLPITFGVLPTLGVDVSATYGGLAEGKRLTDLKEPTCMKVSVVTFEPEEIQSFKVSTYVLLHRP